MTDEFDIEKIINDLNPESRAKPLHELVTEEYFSVREVLSQTSSTSFTPNSEMIFGGRSPEYQGGYTSDLVLGVISRDNLPITSLRFKGISAVRRGDFILAKIPRYEEAKSFRHLGESICGGEDDLTKTVYLPRQEYNAEEEAIEIQIIETKHMQRLRTDRSVNYQKFAKRE